MSVSEMTEPEPGQGPRIYRLQDGLRTDDEIGLALPADTPEEVKALLRCETLDVLFAPGRKDWFGTVPEGSPAVDVAFAAGSDGGVTLIVDFGFDSGEVGLTIVDHELHVDGSALRPEWNAPLQSWVTALNRLVRMRGYGFESLAIEMHKVPRSRPAASSAPHVLARPRAPRRVTGATTGSSQGRGARLMASGSGEAESEIDLIEHQSETTNSAKPDPSESVVYIADVRRKQIVAATVPSHAMDAGSISEEIEEPPVPRSPLVLVPSVAPPEPTDARETDTTSRPALESADVKVREAPAHRPPPVETSPEPLDSPNSGLGLPVRANQSDPLGAKYVVPLIVAGGAGIVTVFWLVALAVLTTGTGIR